jgi:hypothetical protein
MLSFSPQHIELKGAVHAQHLQQQTFALYQARQKAAMANAMQWVGGGCKGMTQFGSVMISLSERHHDRVAQGS